jgi:GNAT superfamily N-acetyltransferase
MLRAFPAETSAERERFCQLSDLAPITPEQLEQSQANAHWMLEEQGAIQARCSLWWRNVPVYQNWRIGLIGHYAATNSRAAQVLLRLTCEVLAVQGCTLAIGPMDGSTHNRYRLVSERGTAPAFLLEPDNPGDWPLHFTKNGFNPLANYYSSMQVGFEHDEERYQSLLQHFAAKGITLRQINMAHFEDDLRRIYALVATSFKDNFLATPQSEEDFLAQYRPVQPFIQPELVQLALRGDELLGFVFAIPDWLQAQRDTVVDTLIVKTLAVDPGAASQGLGTLLAGRLSTIAQHLGYRRAIHALMHENNTSRRISQSHHGTIIRRYTLYSKELGGHV